MCGRGAVADRLVDALQGEGYDVRGPSLRRCSLDRGSDRDEYACEKQHEGKCELHIVGPADLISNKEEAKDVR